MTTHDNFSTLFAEDIKESAGDYQAAADELGCSERTLYRYRDADIKEDRQASFVANARRRGLISKRTARCYCETRCSLGQDRKETNYKNTKKTALHSGLNGK